MARERAMDGWTSSLNRWAACSPMFTDGFGRLPAAADRGTPPKKRRQPSRAAYSSHGPELPCKPPIRVPLSGCRTIRQPEAGPVLRRAGCCCYFFLAAFFFVAFLAAFFFAAFFGAAFFTVFFFADLAAFFAIVILLIRKSQQRGFNPCQLCCLNNVREQSVLNIVPLKCFSMTARILQTFFSVFGLCGADAGAFLARSGRVGVFASRRGKSAPRGGGGLRKSDRFPAGQDPASLQAFRYGASRRSGADRRKLRHLFPVFRNRSGRRERGRELREPQARAPFSRVIFLQKKTALRTSRAHATRFADLERGAFRRGRGGLQLRGLTGLIRRAASGAEPKAPFEEADRCEDPLPMAIDARSRHTSLSIS